MTSPSKSVTWNPHIPLTSGMQFHLANQKRAASDSKLSHLLRKGKSSSHLSGEVKKPSIEKLKDDVEKQRIKITRLLFCEKFDHKNPLSTLEAERLDPYHRTFKTKKDEEIKSLLVINQSPCTPPSQEILQDEKKFREWMQKILEYPVIYRALCFDTYARVNELLVKFFPKVFFQQFDGFSHAKNATPLKFDLRIDTAKQKFSLKQLHRYTLFSRDDEKKSVATGSVKVLWQIRGDLEGKKQTGKLHLSEFELDSSQPLALHHQVMMEF